MGFETPQTYRWRDPNWPREIPSLQLYFLNEPQVNAEKTQETGIQTFDNVLTAYVSPMGLAKSNMAHEVRRTLHDGTVINHPVNAYKYAEQLKLYDAGTGAEAIGTPLKEIVGMTPAMVMNLKARGIHTVEMLSEMGDAAGGELMGFWELRDKAKKHIELREKNAPMLKIEAVEEKHKQEVAALQKQIADLTALVEEKTKPKAKAA